MKQESVDYFRRRQRAEREAVRNATCEEARWAHRQMAAAYARLIELEELEAAGAVDPGKLITRSEALRARNHAEHSRSTAPLRNAAGAPVRRI